MKKLNDMKNKFGIHLFQNKENNSLREPIIFETSNQKDQQGISHLFETGKISEVVDVYDEQIQEYREVKNPALIFKPENKKSTIFDGVWVYLPWSGKLVHILEKNKYNITRISRNNPFIGPADQKKLEKLKIGIAGLNVGNPGAVCMALGGVGNSFKLADFDTLSLTNLNRFRAGLSDLGKNKARLTAEQMYEVNPYLKIELFEEGIQDSKIDSFLLKPRIDILIEETDNLPLKIKIRERARMHGIPVLMVTGNGSNVIVDVERFDKDNTLPLMSGFLKESVIETVKEGPKDFDTKILLARDFMGSKFLVPKLRESFSQIGKSLAGIPQLGEASFMRGAVLSYFTRAIFSDKNSISSGRYVVELDTIKQVSKK